MLITGRSGHQHAVCLSAGGDDVRDGIGARARTVLEILREGGKHGGDARCLSTHAGRVLRSPRPLDFRVGGKRAVRRRCAAEVGVDAHHHSYVAGDHAVGGAVVRCSECAPHFHDPRGVEGTRHLSETKHSLAAIVGCQRVNDSGVPAYIDVASSHTNRLRLGEHGDVVVELVGARSTVSIGGLYGRVQEASCC